MDERTPAESNPYAAPEVVIGNVAPPASRSGGLSRGGAIALGVALGTIAGIGESLTIYPHADAPMHWVYLFRAKGGFLLIGLPAAYLLVMGAFRRPKRKGQNRDSVRTTASALAFLLTAAAPADTPALRVPDPTDLRGVFEASGLDDSVRAEIARDPGRASAFFKVATVGPGERPTLFGTYTLDGPTLRFRPRFPLEPGVRYRATLAVPGQAAPVVADLDIPALPAPEPSTRVVRVSPTGAILPENLLKFYVEFSAPMGRGEAYERLSLLDGAGKPIDLPFLELGEELWDPAGKRFTILFDPGRIKSGLRPREEAGPVLEEGKAYTLVIDRAWRDARGAALVESFRKPFRVGPADRTPPDPAGWALTAPAAGGRDPLVVRFPEPLDRAMLGRVLGVAGPDGAGVPGTPAVGDDETTWRFTPERPWAAGAHCLLVDRSLEDRAGNTIGRPFEVDVFEKIDRTTASEPVAVPFRVGP